MLILRLLPPRAALLAFLAAFALFFLRAVPVFWDNDAPWHLAAGRWMLGNGALPLTDPWSFSAGGAPWYNLSWLFDLGFAVVVGSFGEHGAAMTSYALMALALALLAVHLAWLSGRPGGPRAHAVAAVLLLSLLVFFEYGTGRPQMMTCVLLAGTHFLLSRAWHEARLRGLLLLPLFMLAWVNLHGGFLAAFVLIGVYFLCALRAGKHALAARLFAVGALCVAAAFATPYGLNLPAALSGTFDGRMFHEITEWQPFNIGLSPNISWWLLAFLLTFRWDEPSVSLPDRLLAVVWCILMFTSFRHGMVLATVAAPAFACHLQQLFDRHGLFRGERRVAPGNDTALRAVLLAVAFLAFAASLTPPAERLASRLRDTWWAGKERFDVSDVLGFIRTTHPHWRYINDYDLGGPLIYGSGGALKLFIDGRAGTAYPAEVIQDFLDWQAHALPLSALARRYSAQGLILSNHSELVKIYDFYPKAAGVEKIYAGRQASVYRILLEQ